MYAHLVYHHCFFFSCFITWNINITGYCTSLRTRFLVKHSILNLLRKRYGEILVKNVRKFEKYDFKYKKAIHDLDFLLTSKEKNMPRFLRFKLADRQLQFSNTYNIWKNDQIKRYQVNAKQNLTSIKGVLHHKMCFIDFVHITTIFWVSNDKQFLKSKKFTVMIIITILLRHTMLVRSFLIF